ncbi:RHS repeat-associated core domain-containing protein [Paenibacillus sp. S-12]|uniref:RHS repeat-associated core domain-containing protein n=1 Tax=Paenibacillus sp. S-12 TaxID=3031371 RepID=UPI00338F7568
MEGNGSVTITASYVHDSNGKLLARQVPGQGMHYYVSNGHGDITEIRDAQGNVLNRYTYDIWGNPLVQEEQVPNIFRYSGEYSDEATNLQYLRARWYDPSIGRFINEDTYEGELGNPLTLNLYTYVQNNPLIYWDPSGHRYESYQLLEIQYVIDEAMQITSKNPDYWNYRSYLGSKFQAVFDDSNNNRFKYLFGLLTQTSPYENSKGNAEWARGQLLDKYDEWQMASLLEAAALGGSMAFGLGQTKGMFGANGAQVTSKTVWKAQGSKARIDVENPNPGQRPGQIHYQDANNKKYLFDSQKGAFVDSKGNLAPKSVNNMLNDPDFVKKLNVGLTQYLGESPYVRK